MKKTILFLVGHPKYQKGGAEIHAYRIANELIKKHYKIIYLVPSKEYTETTIDELGSQIVFYKQNKYFHIFEMFATFKLLRKLKFDVCYIRASPYQDAFTIFYCKYIKICKTVWQDAAGSVLIPFSFTKRILEKKTIKNIITCFFNTIPFDFLTFYAIKNASTIIAQSKENNEIIKQYFKRDSIIIKKGIKVERDINIIKDIRSINICFVRNIKERSRINLFLSIVENLKSSSLQNLQYFVVGKIYLKNKEAIINSFSRLGINYLGELPNDSVQKLFSECHILIDCLEEFSGYTTFSTAFLEAWAHKVVIISFSSNPENVFIENNVGFLVSTIEECCFIINKLSKDREKLKCLGQSCFDYVQMEHSLESEIELIERAID